MEAFMNNNIARFQVQHTAFSKLPRKWSGLAGQTVYGCLPSNENQNDQVGKILVTSVSSGKIPRENDEGALIPIELLIPMNDVAEKMKATI
jgi:hypothetical protein